ncbi:hypothetical protein DL96DRAFT_1464853, partial [Flagelloscypha sp. PMI_526]
KEIVNYSTTLRRHIEATHKPAYREWCKTNNFTSKLPGDIKARKQAETDSARQTTQSSLDAHVKPIPKPVILPYSDDLFKLAATEWLIETQQPIAALQHPKFKEMINVAARATNGVVIPSLKDTRKEIIRLFKQEMTRLRDHLKV